MIPAFLVATLSAPGANLASALSSALGFVVSLFVLAAIPLAAYVVLQLRVRLHRAGKERGDEVNFRQLGKTPVNGSTPNGGGNP
jgi:hypothetical protein